MINLDNKSNKMADFLRLVNLKELANNRLRGRPDKEIADMQNPDLSSLAAPAPMMPQAPVPDYGNFDVRANQVIDPSAPMGEVTPASQDESIWSKIFNGLSQIGAGRSPEQDDEVGFNDIPVPEMRQNIPPPSSQEMDGASPYGFDLKNFQQTRAGFIPDFSNLKKAVIGEAAPSQPPPMEMNVGLETEPQQPAASLQAQPEEREPGTYTEPGTTEVLAQNPAAKAEIERIFGMPLDENITNLVTSFENAMKDYGSQADELTSRLTAQEQEIKNRIESRNLTTQDKILMAIALIAPAVMAGIVGGKEGLVGALGGGFKGLAQSLNQREKDTREDQDLLSNVTSEKTKVAKEKLSAEILGSEFKQKLASAIPNKKLREIFTKNAKISSTGKVVLDTGNPLLPLSSTAIRDEDDYKNFREKEMPKLEEQVAGVEQALSLIDTMNEVLKIAKAEEGNKNLLEQGLSFVPGYELLTKAIKAHIPAMRADMKDTNGNPIKIADVFETLRAQLSDAYRKVAGGGQAFKAYEKHFFQQLPNPFSTAAFWEGASDLNLTTTQLDAVKKKFEETVLFNLEQKGVDTGPIKSLFSQTQRTKDVSEAQRKRNRAEEASKQAIQGK